MTTEKPIALNKRQKKEEGMGFASECLLSDYDKLTQEPWLSELVKKIVECKDVDEQKMLKARLPFRCPHYTLFSGNHRDQKHIVAESFTWQTCVDIDDKDITEEAKERAMRLNNEEGSLWQGKLLHMDYSSRHGLHIDIRLPLGMTVPEAQRCYSEALQVKPDTTCFSPERILYISPASHEIYRSDSWYEPLGEEEVKQRRQAYLDRGLTIDGRNKNGRYEDAYEGNSDKVVVTPEKNTVEKSGSSTVEPLSKVKKNGYPQDFMGIAYKDIISEYWKRTGGEPIEGERNDKVHKLAYHLRAICDNNEEWLLQILPNYHLSEQEMRSIVHSACKEPTKGSKVVKEIVKELTRQPTIKECLGSKPPQMPQKLPSLIKLLLSQEDKVYHPTCANAIFPSLGAHFYEVKFPYIDNTLREATFMCCTMAPMSSGKSCVDRQVECITEDIRTRDEESVKAENDWKQKCRSCGANKDKPKRPEGLCVQILESDMTNAAFVQKLMDANGKFLYTNVDEIDLFNRLRTNGNKDVGSIFRLAFDTAPYGQVRVGVDSVSGAMPLRWNWNASTTIQVGQKFFKNMKANGTLSRINFGTIITERGQDIPVHGNYDQTFRDKLKPYIDRLNAARGVIEHPKAKTLVKRMLKENAEVAELTDDELYEKLSYRAVVIAWLKAMTLYVAEGKWSKQIEDFAMWSLKFDLWCKLTFFGDEMREQMQGEVINSKPGPRNLLEQLPDTFTVDDAQKIRLLNGRDSKGCMPMLGMWVKRGHITFDSETKTYTKTKENHVKLLTINS